MTPRNKFTFIISTFTMVAVAAATDDVRERVHATRVRNANRATKPPLCGTLIKGACSCAAFK